MDLKDIAVISGKPGLHRIMKPTRTGVIVESIGGAKSKVLANASHRVSILKEISIYTLSGEGSVPLEEVFYAIHEKHGLKLNVTKEPEQMKSFLADILPDYDKDKVYVSDIKKIITWYETLSEFIPELLVRKEKEAEPVAQVAAQEETVADEKAPKKKAAKKDADTTAEISDETKTAKKTTKKVKAEDSAEAQEEKATKAKTSKKVSKEAESEEKPAKKASKTKAPEAEAPETEKKTTKAKTTKK